jgi:hypothetical protein
MRRRLFVPVAIAVSTAMALPLACSTLPLALPPGFVGGSVVGVPNSCLDGTYLPVESRDCPSPRCPGKESFAVCLEGVYAGCICRLDGELPPPLPAPDGGTDAPLDVGEDFSLIDVGPSSGGDLLDSPLFDVGDLGDCSGEIAKQISTSECPMCHGRHAYALCDGMFYSTCTCKLPPGYRLLDAGATEGGYSKDASTDAARDVVDSSPTDAGSKDSPTVAEGG